MVNDCFYFHGGSERVLFEKNGHRALVFSQARPSNEHSEYANCFPAYTANYEKSDGRCPVVVGGLMAIPLNHVKRLFLITAID